MTKAGQYIGDGTWPFIAEVDGDDIIVRGSSATWFGGSDDKMDDGTTASGISTKEDLDIMGCALPMQLARHFLGTEGSPLRLMPWKTTVQVWAPGTNKTIRVPLIDIGPAKWACQKNHTAIDLTQTAFRALGYSLKLGTARVDYRIIGARKYFP